jgi:hypothetical protein
MLAIVNVTKDDSQKLDDYEIRINRRVIGKFKHKREHNGAAQCLRDAADALEQNRYEVDADWLDALLPLVKQMNINRP